MVWSAYDETADPAVTLALLDRGVDINEASGAGSTVLDWALKRGDTRLVALLRSKGATEGSKGLKRKAIPSNAVPSDAAGRERMLRDSVQRALDLLQRSSDGFLENGFVKKTGCVSCHQQTLPAVAYARARERGFQLDEASLARQLTTQQTGWSKTRDGAYEMQAPQPAHPAVLGYGLQGLHALGYQPDELTAAMAWYLAETQLPDGSWPDYDVRPPMEEGRVVGTALTVPVSASPTSQLDSAKAGTVTSAEARFLNQIVPIFWKSKRCVTGSSSRPASSPRHELADDEQQWCQRQHCLPPWMDAPHGRRLGRSQGRRRASSDPRGEFADDQ